MAARAIILIVTLLKFLKHMSLKLGTPCPTHPQLKSHLTTDRSFKAGIQKQGHMEGTMFQQETN